MSKDKLINIAKNIKDEYINFDNIPELTNEGLRKSKPLDQAPEMLELLDNQSKEK